MSARPMAHLLLATGQGAGQLLATLAENRE
jgi:hypothetical protein